MVINVLKIVLLINRRLISTLTTKIWHFQTLSPVIFSIRAVLINKPLCTSDAGGVLCDLLDSRRCNSIHLSKVTFIRGENCHISCSWDSFWAMLSFVQSKFYKPKYQISLCHLRQLSTKWRMRTDRGASNRKTGMANHITLADFSLPPSHLISIPNEGVRIAHFFAIRGQNSSCL